MANPIEKLIVQIGADTEEFSREMKKALRNLQSFGDAFSSLGSKLSLGITAPLAGLGAAAVQSAATMDGLVRGLTAVSGSSASASTQLVKLREVAKLPGLGFEDAVRGATNLQAAGFSADKAQKALMAFGNALATVGKGKVDLDGVNLALVQLTNATGGYGQEIRQLAQRLPQVRQAMLAAFGTADSEKLLRMGIDGKAFVDGLIKEFEKLPPVTGGLKNDLENLSDNINIALAKIGNAAAPAVNAFITAIDPLLEKVGEVSQAFTQLPTPVQAGIGGLLALAVAAGPVLFVIGNMTTGLVQLAKGGQFLGSAFGNLATSLNISKLALGGWIALVTVGVLALLDLASAYYSYAQAKSDAENAGAQGNQQRQLLIIQLRQAGVAVNELADDYNHGRISAQEFDKRVRELAIAHGDAARAAGLQSGAVYDIAKAFSTLNIKPATELKKALLDAQDALKQLQNARAAGDKGVTDLDLVRGAQAVAEAEKLLTIEYKKAEPIKGKSFELTLAQTIALEEEAKARRALITSVIASHQALKDNNKFWNEVTFAELGVTEASSNAALAFVAIRDVMESTNPAINRLAVGHVNLKTSLETLSPFLESQRKEMEAGLEPTRKFLAALKELGVTDTAEELRKDEAAFAAIAVAAAKGEVSVLTYQRAQLKLLESRAANRTATAEELDQIERLKIATQSLEKASSKAAQTMRREVSTVITDLSRGIAQAIFSGEKLGKVFVKVAEDIGQAIIRHIIQNLILTEARMNKISDALSKVLSKIPGLGGVFGGKTGNGPQVPVPGGGQIPGIPTGAPAGSPVPTGGGAGGAGGAAASNSVAGIVTAVSGVVSAISSVIGNFQMAHMNTALGRIEESTRGALNILGLNGSESIQAATKGTWQQVTFIHERMLQLLTGGIGVYNAAGDQGLRLAGGAAGGGSTIILNMDGAGFIGFRDLDQFLDEIAKKLKQRGV